MKANDIPTIDNILVLNRSKDPSAFLSENPYEYFTDQEIEKLGGNTSLTPEIRPPSPLPSKFSPKISRKQSINLSILPYGLEIPKVNSISFIPGLQQSSSSKEERTEEEMITTHYEEDAHDDESIHRQLHYDFVEFPDYITIRGQRLNKPFVEKPIDAQDHKIHIYYPSSQGGGHKRLFRKINNKSSEFIPNQSEVRKTGSYTYERFLRTDGFDIKVYTVGTKYSHAEARKAPTLDGKVLRQANGKETRYPVLLSPSEKEIVKRVVEVFKQRVCGFDMLRSNGKSYVCDVNGWSFVKGSAKYFKDCGIVLRNMLLTYFSPQALLNTKPQYDPTVQMMVPKLLFKHRPLLGVVAEKHEELRAVVAVIRHGDRTPKQKMKMVVKDERLLSFFDNTRNPEKELKLKKPQKLQKLLDYVRSILKQNERHEQVSSDEEDREEELPLTFDPPKLGKDEYDKYFQMKSILERGGHFQGINRKVQIRPLKFVQTQVYDPNEAQDQETKSTNSKTSSYYTGPISNKKVIEALYIVKWGGELTQIGMQQAHDLGKTFRMCMYPNDDNGEYGLMRLHSTYRHDLKCYSSDEGRCQLTAASFLKGLLDLDGELTPILVSMVRVDHASQKLLNTSANTKKMNKVKNVLYELMNGKDSMYENLKQITKMTEQEIEEEIPFRVLDIIKEFRNPVQELQIVHSLVKAISDNFKQRLDPHYAISYLITPLDPSTQVTIKMRGGSPLASGPNLDLSRFNRALSQTLDIGKLSSLYNPLADRPSHTASASIDLKKFKEEAKTPRSVSSMSSQEDSGSNSESLLLMFKRWEKINKDFFSKKKGRYEISKIPDIYDCIRYDLIHNLKMMGKEAHQLFRKITPLAKIVQPLEHGITSKDKLDIALDCVHDLLSKIHHDLLWWKDESKGTLPAEFVVENNQSWQDRGLNNDYSEETQIKSSWRHVKTRLYFTSASTLYSLLNTFMLGLDHEDVEKSEDLLKVSTLDYLSQITFRMFEVFSCEPHDSRRFRLELAVSPGADSRQLHELDSNSGVTQLPVRRLITLNRTMKLDEVDDFFNRMEELYHQQQQGS